MKNQVNIIGQLVQDKIHINNQIFTSIGGTAFYSSIIYLLPNLKTEIYTSTNSNIKKKFKQLFKNKIKLTNNLTNNATTFKVIYKHKNLENRKIYIEFNNTPINYKPKNPSIIHFGPLIYKDITLDTYNKLNKLRCLKIIDIQGLIRNEKNGKIIKYKNKQIFKLISKFNILKANKSELKILSNILNKNKKQTLRKLFSIGIKEILETNGKKGSYIYTISKKIFIPAFLMVKQRDTTGCGDIYTAMYALFRYNKIDLNKSGLAASEVAGLRTSMQKISIKRIQHKVMKLLNEYKN